MPHSDVVGFLESVFNKLEALDSAYIAKNGLDDEDGTTVPAPSPAPLRAVPRAAKAGSAPAPTVEPVGKVAATPAVDTVGEEAQATPAPTPAPVRPARATPVRSPQLSLRRPEDQVDGDRWPGVYPDKIVCLEDQAETVLLKSYVKNRFDLKWDEYLEKWNLPQDYPTAPPVYKERKSASAKERGLGTTLRPKKKEVKPEPTRKPGTLSPNYAGRS